MTFKDNINLYPTPDDVIQKMVEGIDFTDKKILEPHFGTCAIVNWLIKEGITDIIGCEVDPDLRLLARGKVNIIGEDFFNVTSDQISHVDIIILNPPFDKGGMHLLHAYKIAPDGCIIISLLNYETVNNPYSKGRKELRAIIDTYGSYKNIGDAFSTAERKTAIDIALVKIQKPAVDYQKEFDGFFEEEDQEEAQSNGIMSYNAVRDLVNRYVESIKIFDQQLETAVKLNAMRNGYFDATFVENERSRFSDDKSGSLSISITPELIMTK